MTADVIQDMLFRVLGGLGLFMLGMEFLSDGIQSLAVSRMRRILERFTTNRILALLTGTFITGVIQSSTVMTVMVVGFVNSGIVTLEQAMGLVMGANIGTTLTTIFVALPIGKWGLPVIGVAGLVYLFGRRPKLRFSALAVLGLGMIFFGLDLLTSGFRPLRSAPEVVQLFTLLSADHVAGLLASVLISAAVTAVIHSSSATIGIVMGLGGSGVIDWHTALAFTLGADIGTTATSYVAALNMSVNARRTAYAHLTFNVVGVAVMLPLFPVAARMVGWAVGGDPGKAVMVNGAETFPLVPIAIATYSTGFNIFNTALMLPFVPLLARLLARVGQGAVDEDDLALPRYLSAKTLREPEVAVALLVKEQQRWLDAVPRHLAFARGPHSPAAAALGKALASLGREVDDFAAALLKLEMPAETAARMIRVLQEKDYARSLAQKVGELAQATAGAPLSPSGAAMVDVLVEATEAVLQEGVAALASGQAEDLRLIRDATYGHGPHVTALRMHYLDAHPGIPLAERTRLLGALAAAEGVLWTMHRLIVLRLGEESAPAGAVAAQPVPA